MKIFALKKVQYSSVNFQLEKKKGADNYYINMIIITKSSLFPQ